MSRLRARGLNMPRRSNRIVLPSGTSPLLIFGPALQLWLRSDLGITLNGSNVSAWADQSGCGDANRNVAQGTPANQPVYTASDANYGGQPSLSSAAAVRWLFSGVWNTNFPQPTTIFSAGTPSSTVGGRLYGGSTLNAGSRQEVLADTGPKWALFGGSVLDGTTNSATRSVCCCVYNGNSSQIYVSDPVTPQVTGVGGTNTIDRIGILNTVDAAVGAASSEIVEIFVVSRACTASEIASSMNYMKARYGL